MPAFSNPQTVEMLQEEIDELEKDEQEGLQVDDPNKQLTPEEETWKKRHGDLRRHTQKIQDDLNAKITNLTQQVEAVTKKEISYPKTPAEVEAWARKYPDLFKIFKTVALSEMKNVNEEVEKVRTEISESKLEAKKERARLELEKAHPDFFTDIDPSKEFHEWLATKSQRTRDAIYENDTDWEAASEVVAFYKAAQNKTQEKPTRSNAKDAAREVSTRTSVNVKESGQYDFKESEIESMSSAEYNRYEAEIDKAQKEGRILYDMRN